MNKNFTPPSKEPTGTVEKTLSIEPDRHFEVALQSGNCLGFNDECNFVKFVRGLAFFQNHQNQKKEITLAIIPINNINYILNKENLYTFHLCGDGQYKDSEHQENQNFLLFPDFPNP